MQGNAASELSELRERVSYLRSQLEIAEVKLKTQRDDTDDLVRAHKTQLGDLEDQSRRCVEYLLPVIIKQSNSRPKSSY